MDVRLAVQSGELLGREITVRLPEFVIGRDVSCHFRIDHDQVSDRHCRIFRRGLQILIQDLESISGTAVNDEYVLTAVLHAGDHVKVGPTSFEVRIKLEPGDELESARHPKRTHDPSLDSPAVESARQILERLRGRKEEERPVEHKHRLLPRGKSRLIVQESQGIAVVTFADRAIVHEDEVQRVSQELDDLIEQGKNRIVLDLENIKHLSSQAIGAMLQAHRRCKASGGLLKICGPGQEVDEIFEIMNLRKAVEIYRDQDSALDSPWPPPSAVPFSVSSAQSAGLAESARGRGSSLGESGGQGGSRFDIPAVTRASPTGVVTETVKGPARVRLIIDVGRSQGQAIEVHGPRFVIGRDPRCQLRPNSPTISRTHTVIDQREGRVFVRDLGATNGTTLNDRVLHREEAEVHDGDKLQIGPLSFTFSIGSQPKPALPKVEEEVASWLFQGEGEEPDALNDTVLLQMPPPSTPPGLPSDIFHLRCELVSDVLVATILTPDLREEAAVAPIRRELQMLAEQPVPKRLVIRLSEVTAISNRAVGVLLAHAQRLGKQSGSLRLCNASEELMAALDQTTLPEVIEIYETADEAVLAHWP
jgi:anti-anti-sigma factor